MFSNENIPSNTINGSDAKLGICLQYRSKNFGPLLVGLRELEPGDYHKGYMQLCATLTSCPEISEAQFHQILAEREAGRWHTWVLTDSVADQERLVATISLHLERKFYRDGRYVGHIEDLIVLPEYQQHQLGKSLMQFAIDKAEAMNCYKIILDCDERLQEFYSKSDLKYSNIQMAKYF